MVMIRRLGLIRNEWKKNNESYPVIFHDPLADGSTCRVAFLPARDGVLRATASIAPTFGGKGLVVVLSQV